MTGDRRIRAATVAAVVCVGLVAAVLSYRHQFELAAGHGESRLTAALLPVSVDGLLLAGTLAVLDAARRSRGPAWAARATVGLGVAMTCWANVVHGIGYGPAGVIISGWPPVALIAAVEVLARMVRPSRQPGDGEPSGPAAPAVPIATVAATAEDAARMALQASIAAGNPLSQRQLADRFGITRPAAAKVARAVATASNGHGGEGVS